MKSNRGIISRRRDGESIKLPKVVTKLKSRDKSNGKKRWKFWKKCVPIFNVYATI